MTKNGPTRQMQQARFTAPLICGVTISDSNLEYLAAMACNEFMQLPTLEA